MITSNAINIDNWGEYIVMDIKAELQEIEKTYTHRAITNYGNSGGKFYDNDGNLVINFSSNDYLNLSHNVMVKEKAQEVLEVYGASMASSRLLTGSLDLYSELEDDLAKHFGFDNAIIYGSGYMANYGMLATIADSKDFFVFDRLSHASIIDGIIASKAKFRSFWHNDVERLQEILEKNSSKGYDNIYVITESVFSMDGDVAPLDKIDAVCKEYDAKLIVDESHSGGVYYGGLSKSFGVKPYITIGSFGKALASYGGFILSDNDVYRLLLSRSRPLIYSTAIPPVLVSCAKTALELSSQNNGEMGKRLISTANYFAQIFNVDFEGRYKIESNTHIIPIEIGDERKALEVSTMLQEKRFIVKAVRYPTVPKGSARLRVTVTLAHTDEDMERLLAELNTALK